MRRHERLPDRVSADIRHYGSSLIEVMIVITISSVLVGVAMTGLSRLFRAQSREVTAVSQAAVWRRLTTEFRHDVHTCASASLASDQQLELQTADGLIIWSATDGVARRTFQTSPPDDAGASVPAEEFRCTGHDITFAMETPEGVNTPVASIRFERTAADGNQPSFSVVEAHIAMFHRFQQTSSATEDAL